MRSQIKGRRFSRHSSQRKALMRSLACALLEHESIKTTLAKAKEIRPFVEKLITSVSRRNDLSVRRRLIGFLRSHVLVEKVLSVLSNRFRDRPGGYLRIIKAGPRQGDRAPMGIIQFVDYELPRSSKVKEEK